MEIRKHIGKIVLGVGTVATLAAGEFAARPTSAESSTRRFSDPAFVIKTNQEPSMFQLIDLNGDSIEEAIVVEPPVESCPDTTSTISIWTRGERGVDFTKVFSTQTKNPFVASIGSGRFDRNGTIDLFAVTAKDNTSATQDGSLEVLLNRSEWRFATTSLEFNGMPYDVDSRRESDGADALLVTTRANEGVTYPVSGGKLHEIKAGVVRETYDLVMRRQGNRGDFPDLNIFNPEKSKYTFSTVFYPNITSIDTESKSQHVYDIFKHDIQGNSLGGYIVSYHPGAPSTLVVHDSKFGFLDEDCDPDWLISFSTSLDGQHEVVTEEEYSDATDYEYRIGHEYNELPSELVFQTVDYADVTDDNKPDAVGANPGKSLNYCIQETIAEKPWSRLGRCMSEPFSYGPISTEGAGRWNAWSDHDGDGRKDYYVIDEAGIKVALQKPLIEGTRPKIESCKRQLPEATPEPQDTESPIMQSSPTPTSVEVCLPPTAIVTSTPTETSTTTATSTPTSTVTSTAPKAIFYNYLPATWVRVRP